MLRKLTNSLIINKNLLRKIGSCFSSNPQPNRNNQQPNIDPPSNDPLQNPIKQDTKNIRSQARLFVCRSQLYKYAKAEVDYEKLNSPTKQIQKVQRILQQFNIKIKNVVNEGPLIEFHRAQQASKKSEKRQKKDEKQKSDLEEEQLQQQDLKLEFKVYMKPFEQLRASESKEFQRYFQSLQDFFGEIIQQEKQSKGENLFNVGKKRSGSLGSHSFREYKNSFGSVDSFSKEGIQRLINPQKFANKKQSLENFKEFQLYMRNVRNQGSKWVKFELLVEDWRNVHFYRISIVDNAQQDAKGKHSEPKKYISPEAKQLDKELLELLKMSLQSVQQIDPLMFLAIYYYSGMKEQECYRKWLEDLVDLTK